MKFRNVKYPTRVHLWVRTVGSNGRTDDTKTISLQLRLGIRSKITQHEKIIKGLPVRVVSRFIVTFSRLDCVSIIICFSESSLTWM